MITPGQKYLITTNEWFTASDGEVYKAAFGTVHSIVDAEALLGIKPNRNAVNWYLAVGDLIIAGCQIHYATRTDSVDFTPPSVETPHEGQNIISRRGMSMIYDADKSGLVPAI